jgi:hypothetical protein
MFDDWARSNGVLHADAFDYAPDENEVRASLFEQDPIEWNR